MASFDCISTSQLSRLIGTPDAPILIDVRVQQDRDADPRRVPGASFADYRDVASWAPSFAGKDVVVICQRGLKLSHGTAAWIRHCGGRAESLDGGFEAWVAAGAPTVDPKHLPTPDAQGRTLWVTRSRPKIDRIACPWLIRRFVDPSAVFLFVAPSEVPLVADRFGAVPFDIDETFWSHRGDRCTFDVMVEEFGIDLEPLNRVATIVRGADTARPDLAPEAAGLVAVSLGLSRMYRDDLAQLDAGMAVYDALFRWARDASEETHDWTGKPAGGRR